MDLQLSSFIDASLIVAGIEGVLDVKQLVHRILGGGHTCSEMNSAARHGFFTITLSLFKVSRSRRPHYRYKDKGLKSQLIQNTNNSYDNYVFLAAGRAKT